MREEGCPPPTLQPETERVVCILPAHPRHAVLRDLRAIEQAMAIGDFGPALDQVRTVLDRDPLNHRAIQLFAELHYTMRAPEPVYDFIMHHSSLIKSLPANVLVQLSETLLCENPAPEERSKLAGELLQTAAKGRLEEWEFRRITVALHRSGNDKGAVDLINDQLQKHPEWARSASIRQQKGNALIGLAKRCRSNTKRREIPRRTREISWEALHRYLDEAEYELNEALTIGASKDMAELIRRDLEFLKKLRLENSRKTPLAESS
jgi:hypothetical protein